ncbi:HAMP domain-containing sensor histidine kinase [Danxiaibacter flavus]|uniref:histidine kinase n=1 Tax=Danxiaibacter flavus TaxID=3049108 RepID=A0ABV3ZL22_9BACT|nr:HAMP domain-containing sensor histidine kinase [Chitinophagaceae bacterium DXS]
MKKHLLITENKINSTGIPVNAAEKSNITTELENNILQAAPLLNVTNYVPVIACASSSEPVCDGETSTVNKIKKMKNVVLAGHDKTSFVTNSETEKSPVDSYKDTIRLLTLELAEQRRIAKDCQDMLQRKKDILCIASHELKTPVTAIQGYVDLLILQQKDLTDEFLQSSLRTIKQQVKNLTSLINNLLVSSEKKLDETAFGNYNELIPVDMLLAEITNFLQPTIKHRLIQVGQCSASILANKCSVNRILLNIISNAVKYSPDADTIIISCKETPAEVVIGITDFGIGIAPEHQKKIFTKFYRVKSAGRQDPHYLNLGVGLFTATELVKKMNGKIWVESEPCKGSTFYISIPKAK